MRVVQVALVVLLVALLARDAIQQATTQQQLIQSQTGIISVTTSKSCISVSPTLECQDEGTATVLELAVPIGEPLEYTFFGLYPRAEVNPSPGGNGENCIVSASETANECLVGRQLKVTVEASEIKMGYNLIGRNLKVPFAYASHHTKALKRVKDLPGPQCTGYGYPFVADSDKAALFYPTVRVNNLQAAGWCTDPNLGIPAAINDRWNLWGGGSGVSCGTTTSDVCTTTAYRTDIDIGLEDDDAAASTVFGHVFFDAPVVTSTWGEEDGIEGNYLRSDFFTGPGSCGSAGSSGTGYSMERAHWCSLSGAFYGNYLGTAPFWMGTDDDENGNDDDDDNDSCGPGGGGSADDEQANDQDGICNSLNNGLCSDDLTQEEIRRAACQFCSGCSTTDGKDVCDASGTGTVSGCSDTCIICGVGSCESDETTSGLDLNINSKMGGGGSFSGSRLFFTRFSEGRDTDNDDEGGLNNSGKSCVGCAATRRSYCGSACADKYMQQLAGSGATNDPKPTATHPGCRQLVGSGYVVDTVYKCIDDAGDEDDTDNTGFDHDCLDNLAAGESPYICITGRPPLYDDCDTDNDRKNVVKGPERVYYTNPLIIGVGREFGRWPNQGYANSAANILPDGATQDDVSFCSADDENCCSASGLASSAGETGDLVTWAARCPACMCMPRSERQPGIGSRFVDLDVESQVPASMICSDALFGSNADDDTSVRQRCNPAFPMYPDDNGDNTDDMHPSDPQDFDATLTVCPLSNRDRTGFLATDQPQDSDGDPRVRAHDTGEAFSILGPYCYPYDIETKPIPYYSVTVTIEDITPGIPAENLIPTDTLVLTPYPTKDNANGAEGTNSARNIYGRIDEPVTASGKFGTNLGGMIVVCNATVDGSAGPPSGWSMTGADSTLSEAIQSPYERIRSRTSTFTEGSSRRTLGSDPVPNDELVGFPPLPEILASCPDAYDPFDPAETGSVGYREGSFWYYVNERRKSTYGRGCKQIGMEDDFYSNDANAATACAGLKHRCTPGYIEGEDWYLQQRDYDLDILSDDARLQTQHRQGKQSFNHGLYEEFLVDTRLTEYTPAVITGIFNRALAAADCSSFRTFMENSGHVPPNYVTEKDAETCDDPNYWIDRTTLIYRDPSVNNDATSIIMQLAMADVILLAEGSTVSGGIFVTCEGQDPTTSTCPFPICVVGEQSSTGHIAISVENVGTVAAAYSVSGNCTNNVVITNQQTLTIDPSQTVQFDLEMAHSGSPDQTDFICDLQLESPAVPGLILDRLELDNCVISLNSSPNITFSDGPIDECSLYNDGCAADASGGNFSPTDEQKSFMWLAFFILVIFIEGVAYLIFYSAYKNSENQQGKYYQAQTERVRLQGQQQQQQQQ